MYKKGDIVRGSIIRGGGGHLYQVVDIKYRINNTEIPSSYVVKSLVTRGDSVDFHLTKGCIKEKVTEFNFAEAMVLLINGFSIKRVDTSNRVYVMDNGNLRYKTFYIYETQNYSIKYDITPVSMSKNILLNMEDKFVITTDQEEKKRLLLGVIAWYDDRIKEYADKKNEVLDKLNKLMLGEE